MLFLWSGLLLLLLVVPILAAAYAWLQRRRRPAAVRYSSLALVRDAVPRLSWLRRHLPFALLLAALGSLVLAVGRPAVIASVPTNQVTIVLAIDVSGSMCSTDVAPSRIEAAEQAASSFVDRQAATTQIGIVAFSGFAELIQPPTNDRQALLDAIHSLATGRRTAIGSGILTSIDAIAQIDKAVAPSLSKQDPGPAPTPVPKGAYAPDIIVLLTDGASNAGPLPLDAAQQAADRGIRVYTIGFGTADGGPLSIACAQQFLGHEPFVGGPPAGAFGGGGGGGLGGFGGAFGGGGGNAGGGNAFRRGIDETTLRQIADLTGGQYYSAESAGDLQAVFAKLPTYLITKHEVVEFSVAFVALGGVLAGVSMLLGQLWRPLP